MNVSREEIVRLARVSRLGLLEGEIDGLVEQVQQVLTYAYRVAQVAGTVDGPSQKNVNVFRPDVARQYDAQAVLSLATVREGDYFVVPAVLERS